jgi:methyl-accepting chemotaxis protein
MKNLSINVRLATLCGLLILPFSGLVIYLLIDMRNTSNALESIYKNNFTASASIKETRYIISQIVHSGVGLAAESIQFEDGQEVLLRYGSESSEFSVHNSWNAWRSAFVTGQNLLSPEQVQQEQELIKSLETNMTRFLELLANVISEIEDLDEDDFESSLISSVIGEVSYIGLTLEEQFKQLDQLEEQKVIAIYNRTNAAYSQNLSRAIVILIVLLIVCAAVATFISRSLIHPINQLSTIFRTFTETGDLKLRAKVDSNDELGKLNQYFNEFLERFHSVFSEVQSNGAVLFKASREMAQLSMDMDQNSQKMTQQLIITIETIRAISQAMNKVLAHVDEVTENTHSLSSSMEELTTTMADITSSTDHAAEAGQNARSQVQSADKLMKDLEQRAAEVSNVIQIISDIANNTKLLALNATIEAARAGDAGKGFAVVSTEVKELSRRTTEGVDLIVENSTNIQTATKASVAAMAKVASIIEDLGADNSAIAEIVNEQTTTTREISSTVLANFNALKAVSKEVEDATTRVVKLAGEGSTTDLTGGSILSLENAVKEVSDVAARVNQRADDLARLGDQLNQSIAQFEI